MEDKPVNQDVFASSASEGIALEHLGYKQEFQRSFSLVDMIGFSFSIVTCWTALSGGFIIGVTAGGPPVMIYGWIGVCVVTFTVALSMAEMCSRWPVAGGQYSWVALLAPSRISRELSYVTGWFMLTGILAMGAVNNSVTANFILGQANLVFPQFTIERWHTVLVTYAVAFCALLVNVLTPHLLNRLSRSILIWNIASFLIIFIVLLATNKDKQPPHFVFSDFQNFTGFSQAMATVIGILQSFFGMCCYDAPSHMTEDMKDPSRDAPKAMIMSVGLGAVTGFIFLLTLCFCIGDIERTANSSTGVPVIQIFYDSTGSKVGTCFMASMMAVIVLVCAVSLLAEGSRSLFAFARDNGLPFSSRGSCRKSWARDGYRYMQFLRRCSCRLRSIRFILGPLRGSIRLFRLRRRGFVSPIYHPICVLKTDCLKDISYALPLLARLLGHFFPSSSSSKSAKTQARFQGPFSLPVPLSLSLNLAGLLFLLFAFVTFNFPSEAPVDSQNMNYTSAAIGIIALVAVCTWILSARRKFTGPVYEVGEVREGEIGSGSGRDGQEAETSSGGKDEKGGK